MRLISFSRAPSEEIRLGLLAGDKVLDLALASGGRFPVTMLEFLQRSEELASQLPALAKSTQPKLLIPAGQVTLKAPLPNPSSLKDFFAFEEHAKAGAARRGEPLPQEWYEIPAYYKGNHREIYGPEDEIPWPYYTQKLDFECEIACVVGKKGRNLTPEQAQHYIFGYMIYNDFSARDIQQREMRLRFGPNKGKDFANAFGPWLVTADEVNPAQDFLMKVRVNGESWSEGHFKNQYWGFAAMLSYVSQEETVYPGDVLGSGTFYKGCGLDHNRWIRSGDIVELEVPKLGILKNTIGRQPAYRELRYKTEESVAAP